MPSSIVLRSPRGTAQRESLTHVPPPIAWLAGTWHVTHSTLPMWRSKRNVRITYTPQKPLKDSSDLPKLDDVVAYQTLSSEKIKLVEGIDTVSDKQDTGAFDWRGKGWLRIASSHWEVLGWGDLKGDLTETVAAASRPQWVVTFFSKTLFTPEGLDIYSRHKEGLDEDVVAQIKHALKELEHPGIRGLADSIFKVDHDPKVDI